MRRTNALATPRGMLHLSAVPLLADEQLGAQAVMRIVRMCTSQSAVGAPLRSRCAVMALRLRIPNMLREPARLIEVVRVNFLLRVSWDRADRRSAKRQHQGTDSERFHVSLLWLRSPLDQIGGKRGRISRRKASFFSGIPILGIALVKHENLSG